MVTNWVRSTAAAAGLTEEEIRRGQAYRNYLEKVRGY